TIPARIPQRRRAWRDRAGPGPDFPHTYAPLRCARPKLVAVSLVCCQKLRETVADSMTYENEKSPRRSLTGDPSVLYSPRSVVVVLMVGNRPITPTWRLSCAK